MNLLLCWSTGSHVERHSSILPELKRVFACLERLVLVGGCQLQRALSICLSWWRRISESIAFYATKTWWLKEGNVKSRPRPHVVAAYERSSTPECDNESKMHTRGRSNGELAYTAFTNHAATAANRTGIGPHGKQPVRARLSCGS